MLCWWLRGGHSYLNPTLSSLLCLSGSKGDGTPARRWGCTSYVRVLKERHSVDWISREKKRVALEAFPMWSHILTANPSLGLYWVHGCCLSPSLEQGRNRCYCSCNGNFEVTIRNLPHENNIDLLSFLERHKNPQGGNVLTQTQGKFLCLSLWV